MEEHAEKRHEYRARLKGYIADIADGHFIYGGMVEDVSLEGLRLNDLPDKFSLEGRKYSIIISGGPDLPCYKLKVAPRWRRKNGILVDVGFNIAEAPKSWQDFVQRVMPTQQEEHEHCLREQCSCCG